MNLHDMASGEEHSSELNGGEKQNIEGGYYKKSTQSHVTKAFQTKITANIVNSIKSLTVRPLTNHLVNFSVDSFTAGIEASLEEQRKTHRANAKNDWNEDDLAKGVTLKGSKSQSLSPLTKEAIRSIENDEAQGTDVIAAAAKGLNRKIILFDEKGRCIKTFGGGPGEPLKIKYLPPKAGTNTGHYEPLDGSLVNRTGDNSCLFDTLASMSGTSTNDLRKKVVNVFESNPAVANKLHENKKILETRNASRLFKGGQLEDLVVFPTPPAL